jgi:hypothetical protein
MADDSNSWGNFTGGFVGAQKTPDTSTLSPQNQASLDSLNARYSSTNTSSQRAANPTNTQGYQGGQQAVSNYSNAQTQGYDNGNNAVANNPMFQRSNYEDQRNFGEDQRRFNALLSEKSQANQMQSDTARYGYDAQDKGIGIQSAAQLEASKYGSDAQVRATESQSRAAISAASLGAEASRYSADASRFNNLLSVGGSLIGQSYRPTGFGR